MKKSQKIQIHLNSRYLLRKTPQNFPSTTTHPYLKKVRVGKRARNKNSKSVIKHVQSVTTFDSR